MAPLPPNAHHRSSAERVLPRGVARLSDVIALLTRENSPLPAEASTTHNADDATSVPMFDVSDVGAQLSKRTTKFVGGAGTQSPESINNAGFLALFAIIGAAMVIASIWFFFHAKNGGFVFQEGDWEDYKSTVLRRKGPDGRTLSNATKSTKLGGSTMAGTQHYKWAREAARSVIAYDSKGRIGIKAKRGWAGTHSVYSGDDDSRALTARTSNLSEKTRSHPDLHRGASAAAADRPHASRYRDRDVRDYKRERPARVGGLNRAPDGNNANGSDLSSTASAKPMLSRSQERAERKARDDAAQMERRWKQEADEAAAALARERVAAPSPRKTAPTSKKGRAASSSAAAAAPGRRVSGYGAAAAAASEVYSASASSGQRSASYYDAYRPRASEDLRHEAGRGARQASAKKGRAGGYRRGADSELT